jgi:hypothetical protein
MNIAPRHETMCDRMVKIPDGCFRGVLHPESVLHRLNAFIKAQELRDIVSSEQQRTALSGC